ncbi:MAG: 16S rRNA (cytosine(1402)-N(4))-methyltransferase RsmH [Patescibacteria group bacterium]
MDSTVHIPVMLAEVIEYLNLKPGMNAIDGTLGGGGHAEAILEKISPGGKLLGIDLDDEAIARARERLRRFGNRVILAQGNFRELAALRQKFFPYPVCAVLLDLGLSSDQLDNPRRGFSFLTEGPLDMRLRGTGDASTISAREVVNTAPEADLARIFRQYGEERFANAIAHTLVVARERKPIETTQALASLIVSAVPPHARRVSRVHPATRIFQALRIAVNQELGSLEETLPQAAGLLEPQGRCAVISFHSLEDRIVKHGFNALARKKIVRIITKTPRVPASDEVIRNPRARSAKLRVIERLGENYQL